MNSACITAALNVQRTLTAELELAARTEQLPKPGSGQLKLFLKSPPQESNTRCPKSGKRNNDFVYMERVNPNGMCKYHFSSLAAGKSYLDVW
jgi:hypothetical protein